MTDSLCDEKLALLSKITVIYELESTKKVIKSNPYLSLRSLSSLDPENFL